MDVDGLIRSIREDRDRGLVPMAVCASAGTANTGTIDPLREIAQVCDDCRVWMHVDGSYGAPAATTDEYAWMRDAFARADSLSMDAHKWLFAPADVGSILVRDEDLLHRTFAEHSEYTAVSQTDPIERYAMFDHGLEMTRRFRGLKVLTILEARGRRGLRDVIARNIALRKHLDKRIDQHPRLEALGSELSIACFRYVPEGDCTAEQIDAVNRRIIDTIVGEGSSYMSPTTLDGRYSLRVCIVNFRTTEHDMDLLLDDIIRIGGAS
jgi:glutamate/tyrosine decarboxylase-like PLP-dependent enzyme